MLHIDSPEYTRELTIPTDLQHHAYELLYLRIAVQSETVLRIFNYPSPI